jgi:transcriptional regulator with XRE-family HTH domain
MSEKETISLHFVIKQTLRNKNLTMEDMFSHIGITRQGYGQAMNGKTIKLSQLEAIAGFLEIPLPELLLPVYYTETESKMIKGNIDFVRSKT